MVGLPEVKNKYEDMFTHFDEIHKCNRRAAPAPWHRPCYLCTVSGSKNSHQIL